MSRYTESVISRLRAAEPEGDDTEAAAETTREPVGGLNPYDAPRSTPGQLAQRARQGRYAIGL